MYWVFSSVFVHYAVDPQLTYRNLPPRGSVCDARPISDHLVHTGQLIHHPPIAPPSPLRLCPLTINTPARASPRITHSLATLLVWPLSPVLLLGGAPLACASGSSGDRSRREGRRAETQRKKGCSRQRGARRCQTEVSGISDPLSPPLPPSKKCARGGGNEMHPVALQWEYSRADGMKRRSKGCCASGVWMLRLLR